MPKGAGGRPTKFTRELGESIVKLIQAGNYMETAAAARGVAKSTLYLWLRKGARDRPGSPLREFSDAVERAVAEAEARDVALIGRAAEKNWQAAAWRLERKAPDRWGRKDKLDVDAKVRGSVTVDDLRTARRAMPDRARPPPPPAAPEDE